MFNFDAVVLMHSTLTAVLLKGSIYRLTLPFLTFIHSMIDLMFAIIIRVYIKRCQCKVPDTRETINTLGPLVYFLGEPRFIQLVLQAEG